MARIGVGKESSSENVGDAEGEAGNQGHSEDAGAIGVMNGEVALLDEFLLARLKLHLFELFESEEGLYRSHGNILHLTAPPDPRQRCGVR